MDSLFKLNEYKIKPWTGGEAKEYFIYPVDSSFENEDFKILFNEVKIKDKDTMLKSHAGYKNYLIPVDSSLVLEKDGGKFPVKKHSTFSYEGDSDLYALNACNCVSLILENGIVGKLESVKFYNDLIIKDDIKKSKIIIFYSCDGDIEIITNKKSVTLGNGEVAAYIIDDKFELKIKASGKENRIIWGKVTLWVCLKNGLEDFLSCL